MKKTYSLVLCATAVSAAAVLSSCKPSQPAATTEQAQPTATVQPAQSPATVVATPAGTTAPAASATAPATVIVLKDPVATVNGEPIPKAALDDAFNSAIQQANIKAADLSNDQKLEGYHQLLDQLIIDKLVSKSAQGVPVTQAEVDAQIAKIKGQFPTEEDFKKQLDQAGQTQEKLVDSVKKMLQEQHWIESQVADQTAVTEADAKAFYDANQADFQDAEKVKATHILFLVKKDDSPQVAQQKLEAAKKAIARAQKGEDFTKLAKELSEEPGADKSGGDLPYFTKDQMVPEFSDAAFNQKVGTISAEPVKTQFGYHVIKVTDKKPARKVPFEEAKQKIIDYLKADKQRKAVQALLKSLHDAAKIDSTLPPLPPPAPAASMGAPTGAPTGPAPDAAPAGAK